MNAIKNFYLVREIGRILTLYNEILVIEKNGKSIWGRSNGRN